MISDKAAMDGNKTVRLIEEIQNELKQLRANLEMTRRLLLARSTLSISPGSLPALELESSDPLTGIADALIKAHSYLSNQNCSSLRPEIERAMSETARLLAKRLKSEGANTLH